MKKIKCEACGSNDLTRKEDYWICDYCNSTYLAEESVNKETATLKTSDNGSANPSPNKEPVSFSETTSQNKKRKVSAFKKIVGGFFMLLGLAFISGVFSSLAAGHWLDTVIFGWITVLMLNGGYTSATGNRVGLTAKFSGWQLTFFTLASLIILMLFW